MNQVIKVSRGLLIVFIVFALCPIVLRADDSYDSPFEYNDPKPQLHKLQERASKIDPRVKAHPEINFLLQKESDMRPTDLVSASVDTRLKPRGKLVVVLQASSMEGFAADLGFHAVKIPFANGWFNIIKKGEPADSWRGDVRLEAATGEDFSPLVDIPLPDGAMERVLQAVKWLAKNNPQGKWDYFLAKDGKGVRWQDVILVGHSHGSTTVARLGMHLRVDRVVCLAGPRDQDQSWQAGPSKTPPNCFFGFTHVQDSGYTGKHYCRSWELLNMHKHGPIVDVDQAKPPYENTRRLISTREAKGSMLNHNCTMPGSFAFREDGQLLHAPVWKYMLTHPVEKSGEPTELAPDCQKKVK